MRMIKSALSVASFTIFSRLTGYFRDILMAKFMGTSIVMDALVIAIKVPSFLRRIFAEGALNSSFIPIYSSLLVDNKDKAQSFLNDVLSIMVAILLCVVFVFEIFMPNILSLILTNSSKDFIDLTIFFSRITFPFILLISLTAFFSGALNSIERFASAASSQIGGNCFIIFVMLLINPQDIAKGTDVAFAIMGSGLVQLLWVAIPCYIYGIRPKIKSVKMTEDVKLFTKRMLPAAFGAGVLQLNLLVDMWIATLLPGGTNSYLYYADRFYQFPISITGTAMGTVLLPLLTKLWRENKHKEASYYQNRSIEFTLLLTLPAMVCLYFFSEPLVRLSFERGAFKSEATLAVTQTVLGFTIGLPAYILAKIFNSSFFARQNTMIPTIVAVGSMFVNLFLNLALMNTYKHLGIALSTSLAAWFNVFVLAYLLKKRGEFSIDKRLLMYVLKTSTLSLTLFFAFFFIMPLLKGFFASELLFMVTSFSLFAICYLGCMRILNCLKFKDYVGIDA
ncbi:MAG: murein biosynthesis integral membrane protein MurJ [Proteobacteria bacterium]|nr:murein biosynthesis integral membrane protein MurJ [Pseudomonadota bacterium]